MGELKRAVCSLRMLFSVTAAAAVLCAAYVENCASWKTADVLTNIIYPMALSGFTPFACLFPLLPFSLSFVDEYNSGYVRFCVIRERRGSYVWRKLVINALVGGLMMALAFGITFLAGIWISFPTKGDASGFYECTIWYPLLSVGGGKLVLFLKTGLAFLFGAVWSSVCMAVSAVAMNRYVALVGTFVLYQLLWNFLPGSPINPVYLLRGDNGVYVSSANPALIQGMTLVIVLLVSGALLQRRVRDV